MPVGAGVVVTILLRLRGLVGSCECCGVASGEEGGCGKACDDEEGMEEAFHENYLEGVKWKARLKEVVVIRGCARWSRSRRHNLAAPAGPCRVLRVLRRRIR